MDQRSGIVRGLRTCESDLFFGLLPAENETGVTDVVFDASTSDAFTIGSAANVAGVVAASETTSADYSLLGPTWPTTTITWSVAKAGLPEDVNAGIVFTQSLQPLYEHLVQQAFSRWSEVSGLHFVEVADSNVAGILPDIRIGWADLPLAGSFQTIGLTTWRPIGSSFVPGVTIQLEDPTYIPVTAQSAAPPFYSNFLVTVNQVVLHEIGHALGVGHASSPTDVMYAIASSANPDLVPADVAAIQVAYPASAATVAPPPFFSLTDAAVNISSIAVGHNYSGPIDYLSGEYIYAGIDRINVATSLPNVFIHGGPLEDALSASSGRNVLDGGTGSNFLTGGDGADTYFVDDRGFGADTWSTIVGFNAGDAATVWGVRPEDFNLDWQDGRGASGYTGLTLHATAPNKPIASLTLVGYSKSDLSNGRLSVLSGFDQASGSSYFYVHGDA